MAQAAGQTLVPFFEMEKMKKSEVEFFKKTLLVLDTMALRCLTDID